MFRIDLADLARQQKAIEADLEKHVELFVRKMFLALFASLVKMNPVDTGYSRNGWTGSTGTPSDYLPPEGAASYPAPQPPLSEAQRFRLGMILWIVNNVNYIGILDQGSSQQAPAGMTSVAFANLEAQFG